MDVVGRSLGELGCVAHEAPVSKLVAVEPGAEVLRQLHQFRLFDHP